MGDLERAAEAVKDFREVGGLALCASVEKAIAQRSLSQNEWCAIAGLFEDSANALKDPPLSSDSLLYRWKAILRRIFGTTELALQTEKLYLESVLLSEQYARDNCILEPFRELKQASSFVVKYECAIAPLRERGGEILLKTVQNTLPPENLRLLLGLTGYAELPDLLSYDFPRGISVLQELEVWSAAEPRRLAQKRSCTLQQLAEKMTELPNAEQVQSAFLYARNYVRRS